MLDDPRSDVELLGASLEDPEQFAEIFRRHAPVIYRYLARRVGGDLAADFTGDVFAKAFELRGRFDMSRDSARPWLYGIASNVTGDYLRRREVRKRRARSVQVAMHDRPANPYTQVDANVDMQRAGAEVADALDRLRRDDRDVLILYAVEGLTYSDVAEALSIPVGTVRSRLSRARRRMGELLPEDIQRVFRVDEGTA